MTGKTERQYRVQGDGWRADAIAKTHLRAGTLAEYGQVEVQVRLRDDRTAHLTITARGDGLERAEFTCESDAAEAESLLRHCGERLVELVRHTVRSGARTWQVDRYRGRLAGLTLAQLELARDDPGPKPSDWPAWVAADVTGDPAYSLQGLAAAGVPPFEKAP